MKLYTLNNYITHELYLNKAIIHMQQKETMNIIMQIAQLLIYTTI